MKQRFYLYQRRGTFYLQDSRTGEQQSLETKDKRAAQRLLEVKRQTTENPGFNHQGQKYLYDHVELDDNTRLVPVGFIF
jgi:hypothetical protein